MSRRGCLLLFVLAGALLVPAIPRGAVHAADAGGTETPTPGAIPTVAIVRSSPVDVPTVALPQPTATPTPTPRPKKRHKPVKRPTPPPPSGTWIWAYLTSYCPGSAGWLSSSGLTVFYGMLANNYYAFGTRVHIPVIGITGVVEDHLGGYPAWNHFDVWSPTCYGTPTGYFRVEVLNR